MVFKPSCLSYNKKICEHIYCTRYWNHHLYTTSRNISIIFVFYMVHGNVLNNYSISTAANNENRLDSHSTYVPLLLYPAHFHNLVVQYSVIYNIPCMYPLLNEVFLCCNLVSVEAVSSYPATSLPCQGEEFSCDIGASQGGSGSGPQLQIGIVPPPSHRFSELCLASFPSASH
jgi:hypothetical protein